MSTMFSKIMMRSYPSFAAGIAAALLAIVPVGVGRAEPAKTGSAQTAVRAGSQASPPSAPRGDPDRIRRPAAGIRAESGPDVS